MNDWSLWPSSLWYFEVDCVNCGFILVRIWTGCKHYCVRYKSKCSNVDLITPFMVRWCMTYLTDRNSTVWFTPQCNRAGSCGGGAVCRRKYVDPGGWHQLLQLDNISGTHRVRMSSLTYNWTSTNQCIMKPIFDLSFLMSMPCLGRDVGGGWGREEKGIIS